MDEEKELALRKYGELYEHSKAVLGEELARSHRVDEKASKYLTALSLVLGALVFFFQQLVDKKLLPPQGMLDFLIFQVMIVLFGASLLAWWFVFSCLRNVKFIKPPLDQGTLDFYDSNRLIDIYYAMTKGNMNALVHNKSVGDRKSQALYRGYWAMNVAVIAVAVLFLLLLVRQWNLPIS
ncbi:MAG: hypothetical protein HZA65_09390 [Rhodocyclales bacterium]|nr:hypothetical protein [Rhodocyclales bacterium]